MNKRLAATVTTAVIAGATALTWTALAGGAEASGTHRHGRTLVVVERAVSETTVDTGAAGDSQGDQLAFANPIYDATNKKKIGDDLGSCVRTEVGVSYECTWTLRVRDGSIVVTGPFLDTGDSTLAITGGTGAYSGARGSMTLHALDAAASGYRFTYRLS